MPWSNTLTIDGYKLTFIEHSDTTKGIIVPPEQEIDDDFIEVLERAQGYWDYIESFAYLIDMRSYWYNWSMRDHVNQKEVLYHAMRFSTQDELEIPDWIKEFAEDVRLERPVLEPPEYMRRSKITKSEKPGFVYLLKADSGHYKIGRTVDPDSRSKTFGIQLPFNVDFVCTIKTNNMKKLEAELHLKYADKRVNGEWFNLTPEDIDYIKGLANE